MKLYKLTDQNGYTRATHDNRCLWGEGVSHSGTGKGELCGPGYIHAYTSPLLAVLLNPVHADIKNPILWKAEGIVVKTDGGLKVGCISLTTLHKIPLPIITTEQKVRFGILCAKQFYFNNEWNKWADNWLNSSNQTASAASAAAAAFYAASAAARAAAASAAADAAFYAANNAVAIDLITLAEQACMLK